MNAIDMEREKLKKEGLITDYSRRLKIRIREEFKGNKIQIMIMNQIVDETEKEMIKCIKKSE